MVAPFRHATAANRLGREFVNASQFNEIAVTDRTTLEGLTQFRLCPYARMSANDWNDTTFQTEYA
jgi:hypothetical protein